MVIDVADPFVAAKLDARLIKLLLRAPVHYGIRYSPPW
jgi:hypothetical protein